MALGLGLELERQVGQWEEGVEDICMEMQMIEDVELKELMNLQLPMKMPSW